MSKTIVSEPSVEVITVTPEMATDMLRKNKRNRSVSESTVRSYARAMASGLWNFVGDPIRFNGDGSLLDGQHRLNAIILSSSPQQFVVVTGLSSDTQINMDIGRKRSFGDSLRMKGESNYSLAASITSLLIRWSAGQLIGGGSFVPTVPEQEAFFQDNPVIRRSSEIAAHARSLLPISPSPVGAVHFRASQVNEGAAAEFFARLAQGTGLEAGDPIHTLRQRVIRSQANDERLVAAETIYLLTRAWNAWRAGEELSRLVLPKSGLSSKTFPTPR